MEVTIDLLTEQQKDKRRSSQGSKVSAVGIFIHCMVTPKSEGKA